MWLIIQKDFSAFIHHKTFKCQSFTVIEGRSSMDNQRIWKHPLSKLHSTLKITASLFTVQATAHKTKFRLHKSSPFQKPSDYHKVPLNIQYARLQEGQTSETWCVIDWRQSWWKGFLTLNVRHWKVQSSWLNYTYLCIAEACTQF